MARGERRTAVEAIGDAIAEALHAVKAHELPKACVDLGLGAGEEAEAFANKRNYVKKRLPSGERPIVELAGRVLKCHPSYELEEALWKHEDVARLSELTRRAIVDYLSLGQPFGGLGPLKFAERVWPIADMASTDRRFTTLLRDIVQHTELNDDWSPADLFATLGVDTMSERRFLRLLEESVHPMTRDDAAQREYASGINEHLRRDGLELRAVEMLSGRAIYRVLPVQDGVAGAVKNLIFASDGPKPEIVLADALNNDIKIVKHAESCLVFDRPIPAAGLRWNDLISWWIKEGQDRETAAKELHRRLTLSMARDGAELKFFRSYFGAFKTWGAMVPALIPQVYLHYDPYVVATLGRQRLARQRMDFLLLLSSCERIVIEIDGQHHYSADGRAEPRLYAEMVAADRELRLAGYEVYRFGGSELRADDLKPVVSAFFDALFRKHRIAAP